MNSLKRIFVYGTLKRGEPNHFELNDSANGYAKFLGSGKTATKYPLTIGTIYNIPLLLKHPNVGHYVSGEVYEVDSKMLEFLDKLEDHPGFYLRTEDIIKMDKLENSNTSNIPSEIKAWIYFMPKFQQSILNKPMYACYSSDGSHGLKYVSRLDCSDRSHKYEL